MEQVAHCLFERRDVVASERLWAVAVGHIRVNPVECGETINC